MARKASRKMPKRGPSTAARKPARKPAGKKPAARKPGTHGRKPPTSGYGAAPRSPQQAAAQGASNFSPEPNRIGRDAYVTPVRKDLSGRTTYPSISTSEYFKYGREGDPGPNAKYPTSAYRATREGREYFATQRRRRLDARNRGAYLDGYFRSIYR